MSRGWNLSLPVLTVLVVCYAWLVAGAPRKLYGARLYGGPSEGVSRLSLRVESVERVGEREAPFWRGPLSARVRAASGPEIVVSVPRADDGIADFTVDFARPLHGPVELELRDATSALLANGRFQVDVTRWAARARRRGGWVRGRTEQAVTVAVAAERGAFVIGASAPLIIRVERAGLPLAGVSLTLGADGGRLSNADRLRTDDRGRAHVSFEPTELNPSLRVEARTDDGLRGALETPIVVVPGGLFVSAVDSTGSVRVESAVARDAAFFSLVSDRQRLAGGVVRLEPNGRGGAVGTLRVPRLESPAWLVASSEVDQNSAAAIGWPLGASPDPRQTFDVADLLLLDGMPAAFAREAERRSRVRWLTAAFIAVAFALSVALLLLRVRAADRELSQHLQDFDRELTEHIAPRRRLPILVAVLAISLGFVTLGIVALARSH